ncbi:MAG: type II secretion system F family protein [Planctomycetota bacterium]|jgi:type IV pilus assembly protein PilC
MKNYKYIARDSSGQRKEGFREALSSNDVLAWLREQGLIPVSVNEMSLATKQAGRKTRRRKRIKSIDLSTLCWQLTTMVEGGIPVTAALETISEDIENSQLQQVLQQIVEKMHKGEPFSDSISQYPKIFNRLSCAMLLAGETSGNFPEALRRLAEYYDSRDKLARKVKGAMAYPIFVLGFIVLIVTFIMAFIIPRFRNIFDQFGGKLPAFTQAFMSFYDGVRYNLPYIIGFIFISVAFCMLSYTKTKKGHYIFSKIALSLPLLGKVFSQAFITTFCRTMATLVSSGVSVLEVLDILTGMTNNDIIKTAIIQTREQIVGGANISFSMASAGFFPNMVVKMIEVGEQSGSLPKVLERTSNYYERKVDSIITTVLSLLEPIMIITVGGIVLVVVLALYLPIFSMKAG